MKKTIIVDIDGTLSLLGDRVKYMEQDPKDYDAFFAAVHEDEPNHSVVDLVKTIKDSYTIVLCTGRQERCRQDTIDWLKKYDIPYNKLLMKKDGDFRADAIAKAEMLENAGIKYEDIAFILEDRNSVVKAWRDKGIWCFQIQEGDF